MAARAVRSKGWPAFLIEDSFGHDGPRRIPRTQKQDVVRCLLVHFENCSSVAARWTAAGLRRRDVWFYDAWFYGADKCTHKFPVDLRRDCLKIDALAGEKFAGILRAINTRWLDLDLLKSGCGQLAAVFV